MALCPIATTGCGGSATASSGVTTQQAHPTPVIPENPTAVVPGTLRGTRQVSLPTASPAAGGPSAVTPPPQARPLDPCSLVTNAQAESIVGVPLVSTREAPLGPTCIFAFKRRPTVMITIEFMDFSSTIREMKGATREPIGGFHAECGSLGGQMLYVSLSERRVLSVTASCPVARGFAVRALARLRRWTPAAST